MLYKLLGIAVWKGGKLFLRRRYGSTYVPKPVLAGAGAVGLAVLALVGVAARRSASNG